MHSCLEPGAWCGVATVLQVPPSVSFGLVPAKEEARQAFNIHNTGESEVGGWEAVWASTWAECRSPGRRSAAEAGVGAAAQNKVCDAAARAPPPLLPQLAFSWKLEPPFWIIPAAGSLAADESASLAIHFLPLEAASFEACAACQLDSGEQLTMQVWLGWAHCLDGSTKFGPAVHGLGVDK